MTEKLCKMEITFSVHVIILDLINIDANVFLRFENSLAHRS